MKNKLIPLLMLLLLSGTIKSFSQDSCKVLKPEISGKYQGRCKNGLADGKGVAQGIDKYEGKFKIVLPSGKGKYTWANGDTYNGYWKNGMKNGEGTYMFKINGADSILTGIWENDIFIKKITPPPYKIYIARDIDRYSVTRTQNGNKVSLKLLQLGMVNNDISDFSFIVENGSYKEIGDMYVYSQVIFPVKIKISYSAKNKLKTTVINPVLELTINDPGEWEIFINN
jgi:hypothetical protein